MDKTIKRARRPMDKEIERYISEWLRVIPYHHWQNVLMKCRLILGIGFMDTRTYECIVYDAMKDLCKVE